MEYLSSFESKPRIVHFFQVKVLSFENHLEYPLQIPVDLSVNLEINSSGISSNSSSRL
jgi:hypothetical protein